MGLKDVGEILKKDNRLAKDVALWSEVIESAFYKAYGRSFSFDEICRELQIAPWDQESLMPQEGETVSQFAERLFYE